MYPRPLSLTSGLTVIILDTAGLVLGLQVLPACDAISLQCLLPSAQDKHDQSTCPNGTSVIPTDLLLLSSTGALPSSSIPLSTPPSSLKHYTLFSGLERKRILMYFYLVLHANTSQA